MNAIEHAITHLSKLARHHGAMADIHESIAEEHGDGKELAKLHKRAAQLHKAMSEHCDAMSEELDEGQAVDHDVPTHGNSFGGTDIHAASRIGDLERKLALFEDRWGLNKVEPTQVSLVPPSTESLQRTANRGKLVPRSGQEETVEVALGKSEDKEALNKAFPGLPID